MGMDAVKYTFQDHVRISGSKYIFQSIGKQRLSNIYHSHTFYELFLLLKGTATHRVNDSNILMKEGDCIILTPQDKHCFLTQSDDMELVALSVQCDEFAAIAKAYGIDPASIQNTGVFTCAERLSMLQNQAAHCCYGVADNEKKLLLSMLLSIYITSQENTHAALPSSLANAVAMMRSDENIKVGVPALMALTNYSYPHLYRLVKHYYSTTPHQLVLQIKLDAAYSKLIHSDCPVAQIAEEVGFNSVSHFIKTFKEHFGLSPAKLRVKKQSACF